MLRDGLAQEHVDAILAAALSKKEADRLDNRSRQIREDLVAGLHSSSGLRVSGFPKAKKPWG